MRCTHCDGFGFHRFGPFSLEDCALCGGTGRAVCEPCLDEGGKRAPAVGTDDGVPCCRGCLGDEPRRLGPWSAEVKVLCGTHPAVRL